MPKLVEAPVALLFVFTVAPVTVLFEEGRGFDRVAVRDEDEGEGENAGVSDHRPRI